MDFNSLTQEQQKQTLACKTPEEMLELAREEGYELSDENLEQINGGSMWDSGTQCPKCHGANVMEIQPDIHSGRIIRECRGCGYSW